MPITDRWYKDSSQVEVMNKDEITAEQVRTFLGREGLIDELENRTNFWMTDDSLLEYLETMDKDDFCVLYDSTYAGKNFCINPANVLIRFNLTDYKDAQRMLRFIVAALRNEAGGFLDTCPVEKITELINVYLKERAEKQGGN